MKFANWKLPVLRTQSRAEDRSGELCIDVARKSAARGNSVDNDHTADDEDDEERDNGDEDEDDEGDDVVTIISPVGSRRCSNETTTGSVSPSGLLSASASTCELCRSASRNTLRVPSSLNSSTSSVEDDPREIIRRRSLPKARKRVQFVMAKKRTNINTLKLEPYSTTKGSSGSFCNAMSCPIKSRRHERTSIRLKEHRVRGPLSARRHRRRPRSPSRPRCHPRAPAAAEEVQRGRGTRTSPPPPPAPTTALPAPAAPVSEPARSRLHPRPSG